MTTTEHTITTYFEEAHGALVCAAKEAHLSNHSEAKNISKLINSLEKIDLKIFPKTDFKKEEQNSEYSSVPINIEYGTTDLTEPKENSNMRCPSSFRKINANMNEPEQPHTFVVNIRDTHCTYEYAFKHKEKVFIHDIVKEIAKKLKCEVPEGKCIKELERDY